ncbi:MAG: cupin domain-containing protein [Gemmatimonadales bacterium]|nr:MAG: cupin domain-containing protein [Gemmatimonadales bacterium]
MTEPQPGSGAPDPSSDRGGRLAAPESRLREGRDRGGPRPHAPHRVDKPWGHEIIWAHTALYAGKSLHVRAGHSLSLQFHEEKDETLYLLSGELRMRIGPGLDALEDVEFREGQALRIEPGVYHWMEALTDVVILEASTPELDDVIRVRDRYGRAPAPATGRSEGADDQPSPAEGPR